MKKDLMIIAVCLLMSTLSFGQEELRIPLTNPGQSMKLEVDIRRGPISIKGTNRQDVLLRYESMNKEATKITDAGNGLKKISGGNPDIEVVERNNEVSVESSNWNSGLKVYLEVPNNCDMDIQGYNDGDISINDITGTLEVETYNGYVHAMNISGSLVASAYNGAIKATFNEVTPDAPFAFSTYNGDIDVQFPANFKADVKMKTERGDIYTGYDIVFDKDKPKIQKRDSETGYKAYIDGWTRGKVNGGGPEVLMKNHNGDIYLRKQ